MIRTQAQLCSHASEFCAAWRHAPPLWQALLVRCIMSKACLQVRTVAGKALKTLQRIEKDAEEITKVRSTSPEWVAEQLANAGAKEVPSTPNNFVIALAMTLIDVRSFEKEEWVNEVAAPYLTPFLGEAEAKKCGEAFVEACRKEVRAHALQEQCLI